MTKQEQFITLVAKMRDAQRLRAENPTRANIRAQEDAEYKVDEWLLEYTADKVQLELWSRSSQTGEMSGAYNVTHESEEKKGGAT